MFDYRQGYVIAVGLASAYLAKGVAFYERRTLCR